MADLERPTEADALEAQQLLLETSLELVFSVYDAARQNGVVDGVVVLLDCEDKIGGQIARSWLGADAVAEAIAERQTEAGHHQPGSSETTVFAYAFSWQECQDAVPKVFPYLAPVFEETPPNDGFLAVSVTCGGASALTVPNSAR